MNLFAYFIVFAGFTFHFSLFTFHSKHYFPVHSYFEIAVIFYFNFDSIDEIGAFGFGLYGFRGELSFIGYVCDFALIGAVFAFSGIGADGNLLS